MNILALACSPRKNGNTTRLLEECLKGVTALSGADVERLELGDSFIRPCIHCQYCRDHPGCCSIDDAMTSIYSQLIKTDALIIAAPIYFMSLCAQAKCLIDRCQVFWENLHTQRPLIAPDRKRLAVLLSVGATHGPAVFAGSKTTMKWFAHSLRMTYWGDVLVEGVDEAGAIAEHPEALAQAYQLGRRLAEALA